MIRREKELMYKDKNHIAEATFHVRRYSRHGPTQYWANYGSIQIHTGRSSFMPAKQRINWRAGKDQTMGGRELPNIFGSLDHT